MILAFGNHRLDIERQIVEPVLALGGARRQDEVGRRGQRRGRFAAVVDPEAAPRVDELDRPRAAGVAEGSDNPEDDAR